MPLEGKCLETNVVYQAIITTDIATESYVGLATKFKERYRNHTTSFRHANNRNSTELSKHVWKLRDGKTPFSIKWKIIRKCNPYNNITKKCNYCVTLYESFEVHICSCGGTRSLIRYVCLGYNRQHLNLPVFR